MKSWSRVAAAVIGAMILLQGLVGLAVPEVFTGVVRAMQVPPAIYVAAVIRIAFGLVLVLASHDSRQPWALRGIGSVILLGGLITPFYGPEFAKVILGWWSEGGPAVVRAWAAGALVLGAFILYAVRPGLAKD